MLDGTRLREPTDVRLGRSIHVNVLLLGNREVEALDRICSAAGISHQQYVALWTLCLHPDADDGLPMSALADGLLNRASDTTRLVDRLHRAGLAERRPNPADRRSTLVRATDDGRRVFATVTPELQAYHRDQWQHLEPDEIQTLDTLLAKALWGASEPTHEPEPETP